MDDRQWNLISVTTYGFDRAFVKIQVLDKTLRNEFVKQGYEVKNQGVYNDQSWWLFEISSEDLDIPFLKNKEDKPIGNRSDDKAKSHKVRKSTATKH